jgi:hypothetical protein
MKDSSRRSFVKTSAATGLTFTFAGLIRAHGQSGGGNTTWNPEGTFFSTNSGETTTYDPNGTYVTTDPGVTTTWDPDVTTTSEITTTAPEETTTTPAKPALWKQDPTGDESKNLKNGSDTEGVIKIIKNKGGGQEDTKFLGKIRWNLDFKMHIPTGPKGQSNLPLPLKKECLSCTLKEVKLSMIVERTDGNVAYTDSIMHAINDTLDDLFDDEAKCNNGVIQGGQCTNGVSVTAIEEEGVAKVDCEPVPNDPAKSAAVKPVIMSLDVDVDPGALQAAPTQKATFTAKMDGLKDFNEENFKELIKSAIEQAIIEHSNLHTLKTLTLPTLKGITDQTATREQSASAAMTKKTIGEGSHCDL